MPTSSDIRRQFIDFFSEKHDHAVVPSSPVVPHDDPTLLFANAGMNQFKDVFLGTGHRDYPRAVNSQKCIRAGGKHNDLEDVGRDTYHHTFFEMLGNWSLGDYFKAEAIRWAWELLTQVWGLDQSRLHVTVFGGDANEELAADAEAADLWRSRTDIDPSHIHQGAKTDNFWEMGDTGPCGPCSEIHYDRTPDRSGGKLINQDDPRVLEIWNLVFIEYNRNSTGLLTPLPARHIDTGMGFERICAVLQGQASNYDTDVFTPLFEAIREVTGGRSYRGGEGSLQDNIDTAYRIIADHGRCLTFALTDGAMPSNEGRGYVLRRILRRAYRVGWQTLNMREPFVHKLVPAVVEAMGEAYPELKADPAGVAEVIREEELSFGRTIERGVALFEEAASRVTAGRADGAASRVPTLPADDAFKLYDTYGFPLDLTQVMAQEHGMAVDVEGFAQRMEQARRRSRAATGGGEGRESLVELVQEHKLSQTRFIGYEQTETLPRPTSLRVFVGHDRGYRAADSAKAGEHVAVVVDPTPFYAEAGGQVADTGVVQVQGGGRVHVEYVQRVGGVIFHLGRVVAPIQASPEPDSVRVALAVERDRRASIMANHTMTHVMNHKLREVLGPHVQQKGSLVDENHLRFDFSHNQVLSPEQLERIEARVNEDIAADLVVYDATAAQDQARRINTLRAVFGEKYPPEVRVVSIGVSPEAMLADPDNERWMEYSVEFCGGTHLSRTGEARAFTLIGEEGVAKGVRRINALTGSAARRAVRNGELLLHRLDALRQAGEEAGEGRLRDEIAELSSAMSEQQLPVAARGEIQRGLSELQQMLKDLEKQRDRAEQADAVEAAQSLAEQGNGSVIVSRLEGVDAAGLRTAVDVIRKKHAHAAVLLAGVVQGKVAMVAAVPEAKIEQGFKAGDWVREVAKVVGGGGGGRPDMAQAGGKDPAKLDEALQTARRIAQPYETPAQG